MINKKTVCIAVLLTGCASSHKPVEVNDSGAAVTVTDTKATPIGHSWGYQEINGPSHWAELDPEFVTCKVGQTQSPIDLKWKRPTDGGHIAFLYKNSKFGVIDNGHAVQVNVEPGSMALIRGDEYELIQVHFHSPSEHTLSGKKFPLEAHMVHRSSDGRLSVLGIFFAEGEKNETVEKILGLISSEIGKETPSGTSLLDPLDLIPNRHTYYAYMGSLTTPPCTEGVSWNVFNTTMSISKEQLDKFQALYSHNNRPEQALNGRKVTNH